MFTAKQSPKGTSAFTATAHKISSETLSGNDALKYATTGNDFVDQFAKTGLYKTPRSFESIAQNMSQLWAEHPLNAVKFTLFLRAITRTTAMDDGTRTEQVQRGAGLRHESIMRMIWLHVFHQDVFWKNIQLFISLGSWKDIITMLSYDLQYNTWNKRVLDWEKMGKLIMAGLTNPQHSQLILKYLPQIKSNNLCKTLEAQCDNQISKWICSLLFGSKDDTKGSSYRMYRKLKTSGTAHQWQQHISRGHHNLVDFGSVHGRALSLIVGSKYLERQKLESKFEAWILSQPVAKFTGYVPELFKKAPARPYQIELLNKQFQTLVDTAKKGASDHTSMIVVRDTSTSMGGTAPGLNMPCGNVAKSLALFFSEMLPKGHFADSWIEFNDQALLRKWKGSTPWEKWSNDRSSFVGGTNFLSVIDLFVKIKNNGVTESEFPSGIICISDGEFDPSGDLQMTNVQMAHHKLKSAGFSEEYVRDFKIVLWNLQSDYYGPGTGEKFESYGDVSNVYYFGGYDGSIIAFLTGTTDQRKAPSNARELFEAAMDQQILNMVTI